MKQNVSDTGRVIRAFLGVGALVGAFFVPALMWQIVLLVVALIMLCSFYRCLFNLRFIERGSLVLIFLGLLPFSSGCNTDLETSKQLVDVPGPSPSQVSVKGDAKLFMVVNEDYSCPFLYSWDGQEYSLENDIYSVARGADKEYTDYLLLNNTSVPKDGVYSFEIRERPNEQSWTNYLGLISVDHPAGVSVGVDSNGNIHSFTTPHIPDSAVGVEKIDYLSKIAAVDGLAVDLYHGDTLLLDFSSVDTSLYAKLVIGVNGFEGELTKDYIQDIPAVSIQTMESGLWVTRFKFFPKEFWAEGVFDIRPYLSANKLVRLVGVSCNTGKFHQVDYVGLDNSPESFVSTALKPSAAATNSKSDCLQQIKDPDESYAFMDMGDTIKLTFPYASLKDNSRSLILVSRGYYKAVGHTFYVSTWDGRNWVQRFEYISFDFQTDMLAEFDLGPYLPDADGKYRVKVEHRTTANGSYFVTTGLLDFAYLTVGGVKYSPSSALEYDKDDILSRVIDEDHVYWYATNKWAIFEFDGIH